MSRWRWVRRQRDAAGRLTLTEVAAPIPPRPRPRRPVPARVLEMARERAQGERWAALAERYGYSSVKAAQNAVYNLRKRA